jgi:hypothetical protein
VTEFDEILSKALEAARYYHPRLNADIYVFPKPMSGPKSAELARSSVRERHCRIAMLWLERLSKSGEFDRGAFTVGQLRSRIWSMERILIPREIVLAMAVYNCVEICVGGYDVWLGKLWDGPIPF